MFLGHATRFTISATSFAYSRCHKRVSEGLKEKKKRERERLSDPNPTGTLFYGTLCDQRPACRGRELCLPEMRADLRPRLPFGGQGCQPQNSRESRVTNYSCEP